jgi:hypothetical protein
MTYMDTIGNVVAEFAFRYAALHQTPESDSLPNDFPTLLETPAPSHALTGDGYEHLRALDVAHRRNCLGE